MPVSDEEQRRREREVAEVNASAALDGVTIDPVTAELQARWARGEISEAEMLERARGALGVPERGFSAASPYEIAQRYAAGEISRAQLVDELARWPYDPTPTTDGYDWLIVDVPGTHTFEEVVRAADEGLLDDDTYDEICRVRTSRGASSRQAGIETSDAQTRQAAEVALNAHGVSEAAVASGFSAASPYEIAQRYAAGQITRAKLVDELTRWPYDPAPTSDGWDSLIVDVPGTHTEEEVAQAWRDGLIEEDVYVEIGEATRTVK